MIWRRRPVYDTGRRREGMGRKRANLKGLTCSLTTPPFSQRPERTPGGHAPETRRGWKKKKPNGRQKLRRRNSEKPPDGAIQSGRENLSNHKNPEGHRAL